MANAHCFFFNHSHLLLPAVAPGAALDLVGRAVREDADHVEREEQPQLQRDQRPPGQGQPREHGDGERGRGWGPRTGLNACLSLFSYEAAGMPCLGFRGGK